MASQAKTLMSTCQMALHFRPMHTLPSPIMIHCPPLAISFNIRQALPVPMTYVVSAQQKEIRDFQLTLYVQTARTTVNVPMIWISTSGMLIMSLIPLKTRRKEMLKPKMLKWRRVGNHRGIPQ